MVDLTASFAQMQKPRRDSKKNPPKLFVEKVSPLFKTRIAHNRKNSCGQFYQTTTRKEDSYSKARPKKHASMDLGSKEVKLPPRELKDTELKRKILRMKE